MSHSSPGDPRRGLPSASSAARFVFCPGSHALEAACPKPPETPLALQGTRIHAAQQTGDNAPLDLSEKEINTLLTEMELNARDAWWKQVGAGLSWSEVTEIREQRLWLREHWKDGQDLASAQVDVAFIFGSNALIIDKKSGFLNPTAASSNWQLRLQALCLWHEHRSLTHIRVAWQRARFGKSFDTCDYRLDDLKHAEREFIHADWRSKQPDAPFHPGLWCAYCRAAQSGLCKANAAYALLPSVGMPIVSGRGAKEQIAAAVNQLTPEDCLRIWQRAGIIEKTLEAVEGRLKGLSTDALQALGLELSPNSPLSEIDDIEGAFNILFQAGLVTQAQFLAICKFRMGKLDEIVAKTLAEKTGMTLESARLNVRELLKPVIKLKPKAPSLVKLEKG